MNLNYARGLLWLLCLLLGGCCVPTTKEYRAFYSHLRESIPCTKFTENQENFLVIYVDARHLDYTDNVSFFKTVAKHPSDGSKNRDVGHAWIYLQGVVKGNTVFLEGGHSGELGIRQAKYFDGIMNYIDFGYANPTDNQLSHPRYEPNPVKYLWETQHDGFFQWGQGRHRPSWAVKIGLTTEQLEEMIAFVQLYNYHEYSLVENQCCSFVKQVAALVDLELIDGQFLQVGQR